VEYKGNKFKGILAPFELLGDEELIKMGYEAGFGDKINNLMIRECSQQDIEGIFTIINEAANAYAGIIPADCYHQPYMPLSELIEEMKQMKFFGWETDGKLVGVMGFQSIKEVTLIRHAYVLPDYQRQGIGSKLLEYLKQLTTTKHLLVGTWAEAYWATNFYLKHGFQLLPGKDELLCRYWNIPIRQIEASVVLGIENGFN
jgi:GNAT superfamily N-acetyltransferase